MEYFGSSRQVRVKIIANSGPWARYLGQTCDAIIYDPGVNPQIDTEQLNPPVPRWQSALLTDLEILPALADSKEPSGQKVAKPKGKK